MLRKVMFGDAFLDSREPGVNFLVLTSLGFLRIGEVEKKLFFTFDFVFVTGPPVGVTLTGVNNALMILSHGVCSLDEYFLRCRCFC